MAEKPSNKTLINKKLNLNIKNWDFFKLEKIFKISLGSPIHKVSITKWKKGKVPYVTRTTDNNGVELFLEIPLDKKINLQEENVITIGAEGFKAFYQSMPFITGNKVNILASKMLNEFNAFFVLQILNIELEKKFNYGRGAVKSRLEDLKIKLPINNKRNPDWKYMESYIKSLPYSKSLII